MFSDAIAFRYRQAQWDRVKPIRLWCVPKYSTWRKYCAISPFVRYRRPVLLCPYNGIIKRVRIYPLRRDGRRPRSVPFRPGRNLIRTDVGALRRRAFEQCYFNSTGLFEFPLVHSRPSVIVSLFYFCTGARTWTICRATRCNEIGVPLEYRVTRKWENGVFLSDVNYGTYPDTAGRIRVGYKY